MTTPLLTKAERKALVELAREGATAIPAWDTPHSYQTKSGDGKYRSRPRTSTIMNLAARGFLTADPGTNRYRITPEGRAAIGVRLDAAAEKVEQE